MESAALPVKPIVVGQEKLSESWLGVPIMAGDELLGALAVASYEPQAFNESDMALLLTIAGQAAMALDNASHHSLVEEQAKTDSLTGVYNHGSLAPPPGGRGRRGRDGTTGRSRSSCWTSTGSRSTTTPMATPSATAPCA